MTTRLRPDRSRPDRRRPTQLLRGRTALLLLLATGAASACLPAPATWTPSSEDTGPDTGPDPGTCEYRRDCGPVVK